MTGGASLEAKLAELAAAMSDRHVEVGFIEAATYPDGMSVPMVAFWNEFGTSRTKPRPFFRRMIAAESATWSTKLAKALKFTGYDMTAALSIMGEDINGALVQSIVDFQDPPNAASTIERKGFNKPLIDTSHMKNSTSYVVKDGGVE